MKKIRTVEEIMEMVEELSPRKLYEFKGQFEAYIDEVSKLFAIESVVTKPVTINKKEASNVSKAEVKKETKPKNKDKNEYSEFFSKVKETGVEHGKKIDPETKPVLAINKKDTDECIVAALINNNGIATNAVWSTAYNFPVVFGKLSFEELIAIKEEMIKAFPEDAEIIEANDGPNGDDNNFYYDELEEGNFCNRFVNDKGETIYFGYIIDENICFYKNADGNISMIDIKYFFMPRWGTKGKDINKTTAIDALIERAFGNSNENPNDKMTKEYVEKATEQIETLSKNNRRKKFNEEKIDTSEIDTSSFRRNRRNRG